MARTTPSSQMPCPLQALQTTSRPPPSLPPPTAPTAASYGSTACPSSCSMAYVLRASCLPGFGSSPGSRRCSHAPAARRRLKGPPARPLRSPPSSWDLQANRKICGPKNWGNTIMHHARGSTQQCPLQSLQSRHLRQTAPLVRWSHCKYGANDRPKLT